MKKTKPVAVYWDPTSVLSALFQDPNSELARSMSKKEGVHLLSALCYAEVSAVLSRIKKRRSINDILVEVAFEALKNGPWRQLNIWPEWSILMALSTKRPLKAVNLWHLASAKTLQKQIPELTILTFDEELRAAAEEEGLSAS
ncbi:MAG: PIN domain-containing protein [Candidatus Aminicenantes bacterium]|nr:PIN domain-containing protein [Candidatus Aminicenantes bacterium]MDH5707369.1 PIN domain-containing protein [Candidatus Aminicenantes bacterium]